jgi:lysophospholipase L1-like esterase
MEAMLKHPVFIAVLTLWLALLAPAPGVTAEIGPVMTAPTSAGCTASARGGDASTWGGGGQAWRLFDRIVSGQNGWYDSHSITSSVPDWAQLTCAAPLAVASYAIRSRCDSSGDEATAFVLAGSNDGGATLTSLDARSGVSWSSACQEQTFTIASPGSFTTYRLTVTAANADQPVITELRLFSDAGDPPAAAIAGGVIAKVVLTRPGSLDLLAGTAPASIPARDNAAEFWGDLVSRHVSAQGMLALIGGSVAVIGDSHTQGFDVSQISPFAFNYGIGGDSVADVLNRIGSYSSLHNAGAIVLYGLGGNDANQGYTAAQIEARLTMLWAWVSGPLVVIKIPPAKPDETAKQATIEAVNAWTDTFLAGRASTIVVDNNAWIIANGGLDASGHLTPEAKLRNAASAAAAVATFH